MSDAEQPGYERIGEHVHIYRRNDRWWAYLRVNGKSYRQSLRTTKKHEAKTRAFELESQIRQGEWQPDQRRITVIEAIDEYLASVEVLEAKTIDKYRPLIWNTLDHGLSNARVEATNTHLRVLTRRAYGYHSPEALIAMAMLTRGGLCPELPGRAA